MKRIFSVAEYAAENEVASDVLEDAIADGDAEVHHAGGRRLIIADEVNEEVLDDLRAASEIDEDDLEDDESDDDDAGGDAGDDVLADD